MLKEGEICVLDYARTYITTSHCGDVGLSQFYHSLKYNCFMIRNEGMNLYSERLLTIVYTCSFVYYTHKSFGQWYSYILVRAAGSLMVNVRTGNDISVLNSYRET